MRKRKEECCKDYYHVLVDDEYYSCNWKTREEAEEVVKDVKKEDKYARVYIIIAPYHYNYVSYIGILFFLILLIGLIRFIIYLIFN